MEKSYISSVAKNVNIARIALIGVPNEIGTSFKVFSLLAQNHINVDIILQGIGHEEGQRTSALPLPSPTWRRLPCSLRSIRSPLALAVWRPTAILPRFPWWERA